jgi:ABC-type transport system substrate-binding protein
MFEGTDQLDFSAPADDQQPVSGYDVGRSIVLVRNPSYDPDSDDLREGYVDRVEITIGGDENDLALKVDAGELDMVYDGVPPAQQVRRYASDPTLQDQIHSDPSDAVRFIEMNLAVPPFDDVNVRRALNLALDKEGYRQLRGGALFGELAGHVFVDSLQGNLLLYPDQTALLQQMLEQLGITLEVKQFERTTMYAKCEDPTSQWALCPSVAWGKDYPDGFTFGPPLFGQDAIGPDACCNDTMVGITPTMLDERGYDPDIFIPSVEDRLDTCIPATGEERLQCWADLDTHLMEEVVPWVPYLFDNGVTITSERVVGWSFDQFAGLPAIDRLALAQ